VSSSPSPSFPFPFPLPPPFFSVTARRAPALARLRRAPPRAARGSLLARPAHCCPARPTRRGSPACACSSALAHPRPRLWRAASTRCVAPPGAACSRGSPAAAHVACSRQRPARRARLGPQRARFLRARGTLAARGAVRSPAPNAWCLGPSVTSRRGSQCAAQLLAAWLLAATLHGLLAARLRCSSWWSRASRLPARRGPLLLDASGARISAPAWLPVAHSTVHGQSPQHGVARG
jgi:hypothetical protein